MRADSRTVSAVLIGPDSSVAEVQAHGEGFFGLGGIARETVHDSRSLPMFTE